MDSACLCPRCNNYFVIPLESAQPSAFFFSSIFEEFTRITNRIRATLVTAKSPTVKFPMVSPQRYNAHLGLPTTRGSHTSVQIKKH